MSPTSLQSFSEIVFEENFQSWSECFGDFPPCGNARIDGGGYYRTAGLTNVGVGDASMVNSSTLCVIGVGQKMGALSEGGARFGRFFGRRAFLDRALRIAFFLDISRF